MKYLICSLLLFCAGVVYGQSFNDYATAASQAAQQGNYREALNQYVKAYELVPNNAAVCQNIGLMYYHLNNVDSAIFFYTLALAQNPKDTLSYYQRGSCYLDMNDNQKAFVDFTNYTKYTKVVNPSVLFYIGKCDEGFWRLG